MVVFVKRACAHEVFAIPFQGEVTANHGVNGHSCLNLVSVNSFSHNILTVWCGVVWCVLKSIRLVEPAYQVFRFLR